MKKGAAKVLKETGEAMVNERTIIRFNDVEYLMEDVKGDGNCFYSSILKDTRFYERFKTVQGIRNHLRRWVSQRFSKDAIIKKNLIEKS